MISINYLKKSFHQNILKWADTSDVREWACAGVATSTLAHYPGPATIDQLKKNIFSREWYIRRMQVSL